MHFILNFDACTEKHADAVCCLWSVDDPYPLWGHEIKGEVHSDFEPKNRFRSITGEDMDPVILKVGRYVGISQWMTPINIWVIRLKVRVTMGEEGIN